ncbi:putative dmX-like protein 2 [Apostichopus japonicus]|uniref:Putative dmX-like protein 2 n=1 Tax=Stichopus japonicus TaxID=307972 RepID=A0A2G8L706_STIJA|nr:putative dmX-like protein 2 [Apostichopus japonicus]
MRVIDWFKIWYRVQSPQTKVGKVNGVIDPKGESYSFIYLAHPRAVTGFSWRKTSKYLPRNTVANCLVTSCRDNICRVWRETLLPDINVISTSSRLPTNEEKAEAQNLYKRQNFSLGLKPRKKRRTAGVNVPLSSVKQEHDLHKYYHGNKSHPNGYMGIPIQVHFHIAATINPNTDIPLLPAIGTMSKGAAPNFVVNWLNNKELQYTLASEMLLQPSKESALVDTRTSGTDTTSQEIGSQESQSEYDDETDPSGRESTDGASIDGGGIIISVPTQSPKSIQRPVSLESSPFSQRALLEGGKESFSAAMRSGFDALLREWQSSADMLYSIHPIDGSFLLWLVEWVDENIPGVHRQPLVSFSCRIPQAFPQFDATSLCSDLILYRSNLTLDHRVLERGRGLESPTDLKAMTPSYSFVQKLSQVPEGVDIFAYTPKVSMLSKHSNGTLNQWEISFAEGSKFQAVLNVSHVNRSAGHRFQVNDLACHPILPLLLTSSHHNVPRVEVDPDIATSRTRKSSVAARRASLAAKRGSVREPTGSFSLFGKNFLSRSEHARLTKLYETNLESTAKDLPEKDEIVVPDEIMDKLNSEMNWPDMSAPTGLCSELILWKVFHVGPLCKLGGVVELARINSPFISSFSHVSWLPSLLPSSCLPLQSNSPSACFIASDGYSLRLFQAVIDARSLLNEISPTSNQFEGYLSSSSPITPYLLKDTSDEDETPLADNLPRVVSLQSTSRPGCIIELDKLCEAKQNWQNVQLMHIFHQQFISGQSKSATQRGPSSHSDPDIASFPSLHSNQFDECFYLVVIDRKAKGQSIIHMWYIRLKTEITKSKVLDDAADSSDDEDDSSMDAMDGDSSDSTDVADSIRANPSVSVSQIRTRLRTYSRRVCSQVLELPDGVEIIKASPAAGHLSSSCIYPACSAPYLLSTACSDGKLRFWTCHMEEGSNIESPTNERGPSSLESDGSSGPQAVDDNLARACYKWEQWELIVREDTRSDLKVKGKPIAVSCAYNGRIACAYRTDSSTGDGRIPLEVSIHECESTGGSEWIHEDTITLGRLNLDKMDVSPDNHTPTPATEMGYKTMKRSSKVEDFLSLSDDQDDRGGHQRGLDSLGSGGGMNASKLPVQLAWASKEDGSHLLTVGLGSKITIFTPNLHEDEDCKSKWVPLARVKLTCVDGVTPFSKMLSWVRAGILVVGLENEMHVYSQWGNPEQRKQAISSKRKAKKDVAAGSTLGLSRNESFISVNLQSLPMSRSEREQSYNDVTQLAKDAPDLGKTDPGMDEEEVDDGLFENSYKSCPVLPQYHPVQLMGLMNCGKINRVNAILSHLVRCIAGDDTVQRAISHGDTASQQSSLDLEEDDLKAFSRSLTLSTSPVESQPKEMHSVDYIELVSVPPLPLYALLAADSSSSPMLEEASRDRTSSISADYDQPSTVNAQDYSKLFASGLDSPHLSPDMFDTPNKENHNSDTIRRKMNDPSYFGSGQAKLLANYLTRMHLPGLSGQDQMHLLALADTLATTKTEITARGTGTSVTAIGREGAGYADLDNMDNSHAGETLDECGLRFLLAMKFYMGLLKSLPLPQQQNLKRQGLVSSHFIWAFHSEAEEELLSLLPSMQKGEPVWDELRAMGVGWWVRNNTTLRRCIEKVAKSQFQAKKNPLDAALFYLAMKKKTLLWGLFRSIRDEKMTQFFRNDFKKERWRKAALKNAFALLGRQRFEHAAAFFLLAGSLKDAVEVCLNNLGDIQLAMVISRLYEEDLEMPKAQKKIIYEEVLGCDLSGKQIENQFPHKDPFMRSMAHWLLKDYIKALDTLLVPPSQLTKDCELNGQARNRPDVFNFYNYLRTHPLIVLRQTVGSEDAPTVSKVLAKASVLDGGTADDEITPEERRLFFATAHMHASAGCPLLALEVLSHLPKVRQGNSELTSKKTNGQLISSGTIDEGFISKSTTGSSFKETTADLDWSKPVGLTNGSGGSGGGSVMDLDWSQPVGGRFDEKLELDWGDESGDNGSDDDGNGDEDKTAVGGKDKDEAAKVDQERLGGEVEGELSDIMAQQLKFTCCLKVMMEELRTLATGFEVHGGQLRYQLYVWLERQVETLKLLCNYGPLVQAPDERMEEEDDYDGDLENDPASLHEIIQARRTDFEDKRQRAVRRKRWLHDNHHLIRTIVNYSLLYGQNGGGLASVCMELVLLMQEVQQETKVAQQLSSPLPLPTTLPLLSASVASSKTVVADPVLHLRHLIHSILLTVLDFTAPPSPQRKASTLPVLSSLSAALSACIYQSLCDSDTYSSTVSKSKAAGMDVYTGGSANVLYRVGNLVSVNRKRRVPSGDVPLTVSSQPSKWPGGGGRSGHWAVNIVFPHSSHSHVGWLLYKHCYPVRKTVTSPYEYSTMRGPVIHLHESLCPCLVHAQYKRAVQADGHRLNERLWASVFGGGAKVRERKQAMAQKTVPVNKSVSQQRNKYTLKLMGKASSGRNPTSMSEEKPVQREVFIAPETSIIDYFMVKPHIEAMQGNIDFDSEASDDSSLDDYYDDDDNDNYEGAYKGNSLAGGGGTNQTEGCDQYSDPTSYSWCLMRYTTVRLALQKLQVFLPSVGIELAELPVASPILHSILKLLEQWQKALMGRLDLFAGPPAEYLQQCYQNPTMSGPSILRYKGLLEPSNTPFTGTSQAVRSVQRYWNFLVRQEAIQDVFIKYIFEKNKTDETDSAIYTDSGSESRSKAPRSGKVRIIHKEQDRIPAFCFNQADWRNISLNGEFRSTPTTVVVSTHHGLMELDIAMLLEPEVPYWLEEEEDPAVMSRSVSRATDDDFLLMHTMENSSSRTSISKITQRQLANVRCLAAHPSLPYYLSGAGDGSVHLWEWGHNQKLYTHRGSGQFPKVSQIRVNDQGNKFGVSDENGQLCLWQMGMNSPMVTKPFWNMQCHSKLASDFVFLGSSSFLATAGFSNDNKNICLWDTLMPKRKCMVHTSLCHDGGCPCLIYCPRQQTIISGSKRGEIALFDLRQRKIRQTFQAHESGIRSLAISPCESFFVSGSAEGNIKVWSLEAHGLLHCFAGQHPKGSFFRPGTTGVLQLAVLQPNYLYSCGADGTFKWRTLPEQHEDQIA